MNAKPALKFPVWATLFTVIGLAVLCGLGTWQLQRLAWKEGLLAQIESARTQTPVTNNQLIADQPAGALAYHRAAVHGPYDNAHAFLIGPRTRDGEVGYHLVSVLQILEDDRPSYSLLVNRGWVMEMPKDMPNGFITVTGLLRLPEKPNAFVPPNNPQKNEWYSFDIPQLTKAKDLQNVLPYLLYAETEDPADPVMSVAGAYHDGGGPTLANNHRQYAFFWFAMAAVLAVIYVLRFVRPPKT